MNNEQTQKDYSPHLLPLVLLGAFALVKGYAFAAAACWGVALVVTLLIVTSARPHLTAWRWLRRLVGHKHDTRFRWGELSFHGKLWHWGLKVTSRHSDNSDMLFVQLPCVTWILFLPTHFAAASTMDKSVSFGFYTIDTSIVWRWGVGYWSWDIPFVSMDWKSTEVLTLDGRRTAFIENAQTRRGMPLVLMHAREEAEKANSQTVRYTYKLRSGEWQERMATVFVRRMTWGRKWAPWWTHVRTCIDVCFDGEVGERAGSWKGGCTGCSYDMKRGESWLQCLRRMEEERRFE